MTALPTIEALRMSTNASLQEGRCSVLGYYAFADGGEGEFVWNLSDTSDSDNGGTVIVDASGRRWHRVLGGHRCTVKQFGAKGDGTTLDASAIQAANDYVMSVGGVLRFPAGNYNIGTTSLEIDETKKTGTDDLTHIQWVGDGAGSTQLSYSGTGAAVNYSGVASGDGPSSFLSVRDIALRGISLSGSVGFQSSMLAWAQFMRVRATGFDYGFNFQDTFSVSIISSWLTGNNTAGLQAQQVSSAPPNAITILDSEISSNGKYGINALGATTLNVRGGAIEFNGAQPGGIGGAIVNQNQSYFLDGAAAATFDSVYFEGNGGVADIYFLAGYNSGPSTLRSVGCTFNKISNTAGAYVPNSIRMDVGSANAASLSVEGCGFHYVAPYVPNADNKAIAVNPVSGSSYKLRMAGNVYQAEIEAPNLSSMGAVDCPQAQAMAWVAFNGADGSIYNSTFNVSSVVRNGTGNYTVSLSGSAPNANYPAIGNVNGSGCVDINGAGQEVLTVLTYESGTMALMDFSYVSVVCFGVSP